MDRSRLALAVVRPEVSRIGGSLIDISLGGEALALQLDDDYRIRHQEHRIGSPGFERQPILENCGVFLGAGSGFNDLAHLALKDWNRIVPSANLRTGDVIEKVLEGLADDAGMRLDESRETTAPARC
jgi:hypothetical protein